MKRSWTTARRAPTGALWAFALVLTSPMWGCESADDGRASPSGGPDSSTEQNGPGRGGAGGSDTGSTNGGGSGGSSASGGSSSSDSSVRNDATSPEASVPDAGTEAGFPAAPAVSGVPFVYVSGYANGQIGIFRMAQDGTLSAQGEADGGQKPSFLAVDPAGKYLYALNEGDPGKIRAYSIDGKTGALSFLNEQSSGGGGPAHLSVHPSGNWVLSSNYGSGDVAILPIDTRGNVGAATFQDNAGANAHYIGADPLGAFVFVPCKGDQFVAQYRFDAAGKRMVRSDPFMFKSAQGRGPRHLVFGKLPRIAYVMYEESSTVSTVALDDQKGTLTELQSLSTLPDGFSDANTGAEIAIFPNGRFVYASNRGDDSIATFEVDPSTGVLSPRARPKTGGTTPRSFAVDPAGKFLLAANQGSGDVTVLRLDAQTGVPSATGKKLSFPQAAFVGIVYLPGP